MADKTTPEQQLADALAENTALKADIAAQSKELADLSAKLAELNAAPKQAFGLPVKTETLPNGLKIEDF